MSDVYAYPDYAALLAAVKADPDSDLPRHILADWLDDHAEADRAELIRLQCELAKLRGRTDSLGRRIGFRNARRISPLMHREKALLRSSVPWPAAVRVPEWTTEMMIDTLPNGEPGRRQQAGTISLQFRRGFVARVTCRADDWAAHGDALLAREPVRTVTLTSWPTWSSSRCGWRFNPDAVWVPGGDLFLALRNRWPGIAFQLPSEPAVTWGVNATATAEDVRRVGMGLVADR